MLKSFAISIAAVLQGIGFPLRPQPGSTIAAGVDRLHFFLTGLTLIFTFGIFSAIFYFAVRYRRRSPDEVPPPTPEYLWLELSWTIIPTLIVAFVFVWASSLYFQNSRPPNASMEIFVVGKQWMWHLQHPEGPREIDELHVPVGVPVKLTMTSEDAIHDFYIPAFRVKKDVLPGRYTSIWFEARETGTFHFFCAQYCGAEHSAMIGWVYVMEPNDYAAWLAGGARGESMVQTGEKLFTQYGCNTCHAPDNTGHGPSLLGLYGHPQKLQDGRTLMVDESFVRQAITNPNSMPIPGFTPVMPSFQGQLTEDQILQLIAYVKSLGIQQRKNP
ncbi:MAG TPA: cytochrome c oxidase subunit II [Candidatus Acidoferrales bacterium]|nr:cytochrome c oxidase subunit II [Candidatus Acidoferrales bacterium]